MSIYKHQLILICILLFIYYVNSLVRPNHEDLKKEKKRDPLSDFLKKHNPECGEPFSNSTKTFIVNGVASKYGEFPWHVGIYENKNNIIDYKYICGGSIISENIILSAAHCFTNDNGVLRKESEYFIAAGKYHRNFSSSQDLSPQKRKVINIVTHPNYQGILLSYTWDIALLQVNSSFVMTNIVHPICIDWKSDFEEEQLSIDSYGHVAGWGNTKDTTSKEDDGLKVLKVPYIPYEECTEAVPTGFIRYVTPDKFCAGFKNGSSVCDGDSGSGLVFERIKNDKSKFYIRGLVSVGVQHEGDCDNSKYTTYTKVSEYLNFIRDCITKFSVK